MQKFYKNMSLKNKPKITRFEYPNADWKRVVNTARRTQEIAIEKLKEIDPILVEKCIKLL